MALQYVRAQRARGLMALQYVEAQRGRSLMALGKDPKPGSRLTAVGNA